MMTTTMKLSPEGEAFIKSWEALMLTPYQDQAGYWTVGWGHKMHAVEPKYETITLARAKTLFYQDMRPVVDTINDSVLPPLSQQQFDAVCAFVFNIGTHAWMTDCTVLRLLNAKAPIDQIEPWWKKWNKITIKKQKVVSNGLVNRRAAEWNVFTKGQYVH